MRAAGPRGLPKSTHRERIEENARIFDFTFSDEDMAALDALDPTDGTERALERPWWCRLRTAAADAPLFIYFMHNGAPPQ